MESSHIRTILQQEVPHFIGVFASDQLPKDMSSFPAFMVVNTDPHTQPGTHWVAFYAPNENTLEFFDSYGQHPEFYGKNFKDFVNPFSSLLWNSTALQSLTSNVYGQYCIYFVIRRNNRLSLQAIVSQLKTCSDFCVYQYVKKKIAVRMIFRK